jgi:hypothetical protein
MAIHEIEEIKMNLNAPASLKHLLLASIISIASATSATLAVVNSQDYSADIQYLKVLNAATEKRLTDSNLKRPTFDEVDTMMDERSNYNQAIERHPEIDYSEGSNDLVPEPAVKETLKPKPSIKDTCDLQKNRLHWELFGEPAPGCNV